MNFRTMINMFDTNQTGTIDMNEFGRLFAYIQQWKAMFENFDRDRLDDLDDDPDDVRDDDRNDRDVIDDGILGNSLPTSNSGRLCLKTLIETG